MQTLGAIFGGFFDAEPRIKCDFNEVNRYTPFIYGDVRVFNEGDCSHLWSC